MKETHNTSVPVFYEIRNTATNDRIYARAVTTPSPTIRTVVCYACPETTIWQCCGTAYWGRTDIGPLSPHHDDMATLWC